jgi:hypothetical protein
VLTVIALRARLIICFIINLLIYSLLFIVVEVFYGEPAPYFLPVPNFFRNYMLTNWPPEFLYTSNVMRSLEHNLNLFVAK